MRPATTVLVVPEQPEGETIRVPVLGVFDGDGFASRIGVEAIKAATLFQHDVEFTARFGFIDAPEIGQAGGQEAKAFLESLIGGKWVDLAILQKADTGKIVDRHSRIVCIPYLAEYYPAAFGASISQLCAAKTFGQPFTVVRNIELEMVVNGWAWVLECYGPHERYLDALADARRNRRGIWAWDNNIAPWEFKRRMYRAREAGRVNSARSQCPTAACGGHLVQRMGRYGAFCGCSNFPTCRYSRALTASSP